ncbi:hypothetical protein EUGRSUZ_A00758 [Eucalyptus grandis]|uniref:Uncharacterized protein n=2 Tax=Eucalyptus grandis TaxID=71139 RepID=A0ACC3M0F0_EUCGR|nr:hypothetical protein EUGRSUZ_A00758 [Eucalyptus grandis]
MICQVVSQNHMNGETIFSCLLIILNSKRSSRYHFQTCDAHLKCDRSSQKETCDGPYFLILSPYLSLNRLSAEPFLYLKFSPFDVGVGFPSKNLITQTGVDER